jgi:hypothetical protein
MARKPIEWRIHVQASALAVFKALDTQSGRESFWAHSAPEVRPGVIEFCFAGGEWLQSQVLERREAHRWRFTYFNDSIVTIDLAPSPDGGTDVTLAETGVPIDSWLDNYAGWVSVLMSLKAAVDFGVDLRNGDPRRSWTQGFVDV